MNKDIGRRIISVLMVLVIVMFATSLIYYLTQGMVMDYVMIKAILILSIFGLVPIGLKWYRLGYIYLSCFSIAICVDFFRSTTENYNGMEGGFFTLLITILGFVIGLIVELVYRTKA